MKKLTMVLAVLALLVSSLACQALTGGRGENPMETIPSVDNPSDPQPAPFDESSEDFNFSFSGDSDFPMPNDAKNIISVAGTVNYQTSLSLDEVMDFYRDVFGKQGYAERPILTVVSDGVFSMVFDGHESGKAIAVQGVDLGDGTVNVNIRFEDG
jgi:hypothetical protein